MISMDTNILLAAVETENPANARAAAFLASLRDSDEVAISEFILLELYGLLRNPSVLIRPLPALPLRMCALPSADTPVGKSPAFRPTAARSTTSSG